MKILHEWLTGKKCIFVLVLCSVFVLFCPQFFSSNNYPSQKRRKRLLVFLYFTQSTPAWNGTVSLPALWELPECSMVSGRKGGNLFTERAVSSGGLMFPIHVHLHVHVCVHVSLHVQVCVNVHVHFPLSLCCPCLFNVHIHRHEWTRHRRHNFKCRGPPTRGAKKIDVYKKK